MSSGDLEPQFLTNSYKIQINILYSSNDSDDSSDTNNYYIIDDMNNILLEEFSNKPKYDLFKQKYVKDPNTPLPLYIINEPFYLDKRVVDSIRKTTTSNFPSYTRRTTQIEHLKQNSDRFNNDSKVTVDDKKRLLEIIKKAFFTQLQQRRNNQEDVQAITNINNIPDLFKNQFFINSDNGLGGEAFHDTIKQSYYQSRDSNFKKAIEKFYNITDNVLSTKYKYEYFLDVETIRNIYKFISQNSSEEQRSPLNNNQAKEELYNKYLKYVFPNKKDTSNLSDPEKDKILMFHNIFYIIKNIYLYDETIINVTNIGVKNKKNKDSNTKKYYISDVKLLELKDNVTHFVIEENKITIFIKATLKFIIENPILQINYVIDDLEDVRQKFLPQPFILQPKDINPNYSKYNKIYIHNTLKYLKYNLNIDKLYKYSVDIKEIQNKEEVFLNTKVLKLFKKYLPINKGTENDDNIKPNIIFLLYKIFKFYNNKKIKNYYIIDTFVKYFDIESKYYSITGFNDTTEDDEKYKIISKILNTTTNGQKNNGLFSILDSTDARLENNKIYKINVVFRCYLDKNGMKPGLKRRIIAEKCLVRAQLLDEAFSDVFYKTFDVPENYLYNKLSNITKKEQTTIVSKNDKTLVARPTNPPTNPPINTMPIKVDNGIKGGNSTKKYNHNNNKTRKYKLR
jgi:hypothetical protein